MQRQPTMSEQLTHTARLIGFHPVGPSNCVGSDGEMDSQLCSTVAPSLYGLVKNLHARQEQARGHLQANL